MGVDVFLSNRIELLFQEFRENFFLESHPFTKRILIVPSGGLKEWVLRRLAEDQEIQIATGIQVGLIDQMADFLYAALDAKSNGAECCEPERFEVALALEKELLHLCREYSSLAPAEQQLWSPLFHYLDPFNLKKSAKRVSSLAGVLAELMHAYGKYGGRMLANWPANVADWQPLLWKKLEDRFACWNYPYRKFEGFSPSIATERTDLQVHLFGLSYLSPVHHRFFLRIKEQHPVYTYLLSPCMQFWSDLLSKRESVAYQRKLKRLQVPISQLESLEKFLNDTHPLLANFGRLGRELALLLETTEIETKEVYVLPSAAFTFPVYEALIPEESVGKESPVSFTLLQALQTDLLVLRNPTDTEPVSLERYDETIQLHACTNRSREAEVVYNIILNILEAHQEDPDPIKMSDILVASPQIADVAPFIQTVFGSETSGLNFQLMERQLSTSNVLIQGFLHLIALPATRWEAPQVLRLFDFPAFQLKQRLTNEDKAMIRDWIQVAGIRWGKDPQHRQALLQRDHCPGGIGGEGSFGTWEGGFKTLIDALIALESFESSQSKLLGKLIGLFYSLFEDLRPLSDGTELSLSEWSHYLTALCDTYFLPAALEEKEGYNLLQQQLNALSRAGRKLKETTFTFPSFSRHLIALLDAQTISQQANALDAVRFCSLLSMRALPAKVIILMGMEADAFPRREELLALNLLQKSTEADYFPTKGDFDRYLFLEALLSARRFFVLSYVSCGGQEIKDQSLSAVVLELLSTLDKAFTIPEKSLSQACHFSHPEHPFLIAIDPDKHRLRHTHCFLSGFVRSITALAPHKEQRIDLADLLAFAKNPLKRYLSALGFYFQNQDERLLKGEDDLCASHLNRALLMNRGLYENVDSLLGAAEKSGKLPQGPFRAVDRAKIIERVNEYKAALAACDVLDDSLMAFTFNENTYPLRLNLADLGSVHLVGQIQSISSAGLVILEKDGVAGMAAKWPLILLYAALIDMHQLPFPKKVIFAKSKGKCREISLKDPFKTLQSYLKYYFEAKQVPSPFLPDWVEGILNGSLKEMRQSWSEMQDETGFGKQRDEWIKWLIRSSPKIDLDSVLYHWQGCCRELFEEAAHTWYGVGGEE